MAIVIHPPPASGPLQPTNGYVTVTVGVSAPGRVVVTFLGPEGDEVLDTFLVWPGQNVLRIAVPPRYPPGSQLHVDVMTMTGEQKVEVYQLG